MKKIIITIVVFLFAAGAKAQLSAPNELHCTEEAITFKANISSGWHLNMFRIGRPEYGTPVSDYTALWDEKFINDIPKPKQPANGTYPFKSSNISGTYQNPLLRNSQLVWATPIQFSYTSGCNFNDSLTLLSPVSFISKNSILSGKIIKH